MKPADNVQCPEYEKLRESYLDAARECQGAILRPPTSVYSTGLLRQAIALRDAAR
jgi:hypothetical protein